MVPGTGSRLWLLPSSLQVQRFAAAQQCFGNTQKLGKRVLKGISFITAEGDAMGIWQASGAIREVVYPT